MRRRRLALLVLVTVSALTLPANAADEDCYSALPVLDPHAASYQCAGVRPGMTVRVNSKKYGWMQCGASFAFKDQFGNRYLTIPGTCYLDYDCLEDVVLEELPPPLDELVQAVWPVCLMPTDSELEPVFKKAGPPVTDLAGQRIGSLAYAVNKNGINFALVRLDSGVKLDPAVPLYGGPTGLGTVSTMLEEAWVYSTYAQGRVNARQGYLQGSPDAPRVLTEGVVANTNGALVMKKTGEAVGMATGTHYVGSGYGIEPFAHALVRARGRTGLKLTLMTAPLR